MKKAIPCLLITYNRLDYAFELFQIIVANGADNIYVAIDGGRDFSMRTLQSNFIAKINSFSIKKNIRVTIWWRDENFGLANSMTSAIDWFFENESKGIILEDDLLPTRDFFEYCEEALENFENISSVWSISGNIFGANQHDVCSTSNYPLVWGWATWSDRWHSYRSSKQMINNSELSGYIPIRVRMFWKSGELRVQGNTLNSWAVPFAARSRRENGIHIHPSFDLVRNRGVSSDATHTKDISDIPIMKFGEYSTNSLVNIDFSLETRKKNNSYLEKRIFRIKRRHAFSTLKFRIFLLKEYYL